MPFDKEPGSGFAQELIVSEKDNFPKEEQEIIDLSKRNPGWTAEVLETLRGIASATDSYLLAELAEECRNKVRTSWGSPTGITIQIVRTHLAHYQLPEAEQLLKLLTDRHSEFDNDSFEVVESMHKVSEKISQILEV